MRQLSSYVERNLFDAGGHTGNVYYIRIVRRSDSKVWNPTTKEMEYALLVNWIDSITYLVEDGTTGVFPIIIVKELPAGTFDCIVFQQLGSEPANTDDVTKQFEFKHGDIFGF